MSEIEQMADILTRIHARADRLEGEALRQFGFALVAIGGAIYTQASGVDATMNMFIGMADCAGDAQAEGLAEAEADGWDDFE